MRIIGDRATGAEFFVPDPTGRFYQFAAQFQADLVRREREHESWLATLTDGERNQYEHDLLEAWAAQQEYEEYDSWLDEDDAAL